MSGDEFAEILIDAPEMTGAITGIREYTVLVRTIKFLRGNVRAEVIQR
jgi:hypothetical protein